MESKNLTEEQISTVIFETLKDRIRAECVDDILENIQKCLKCDSDDKSGNIADIVSKNVLQSDALCKLQASFFHDLHNFMQESEKFETENPRNVKISDSHSLKTAPDNNSLISSLSDSSVVFLSPEQLHDISSVLLHNSPLEKLAALQTLCQMSSLEHLIMQSVWQRLKIALHKSLFSEIHFIRISSFKLYVKLLSSPLSQVVKEGYLSLVTCLSTSICSKLKRMNNNVKPSSICPKAIMAVIILLNRFQQHISSHWLRYPQNVIEEIVYSSVSLLTVGFSDSEGAYVIKCVALIDKEAKWLKNFLYDNVSRSLVIQSLKQYPVIIVNFFRFCEEFFYGNILQRFSVKKNDHICCSKTVSFNELTHKICFLIHILEYTEGRNLLTFIFNDFQSKGWLHVFKLLVQTMLKLSFISCDKCNMHALKTVSQSWANILKFEHDNDSDSLHDILQILVDSLTCSHTSESLSSSTLYFIAQTVYVISNTNCCLSNFRCKNQTFLLVILKNFCLLTFEILMDEEYGIVRNKTLLYLLGTIRNIVCSPSGIYLLVKRDAFDIIVNWWKKVNDISLIQDLKIKKNVFATNDDFLIAFSVQICEFLNMAFGIFICFQAGVFDLGFHMLINKIISTIEKYNVPCWHDVNALAMCFMHASQCSYSTEADYLPLLPSALWCHYLKPKHCDGYEDIENIKVMLEILLPSMSMLLYDNIDQKFVFSLNDLLELLLLLPSNENYSETLARDDILLFALHILSILICNIKDVCVLQSKFKLQKNLFLMQEDLLLSDGNNIIDSKSVILNHILVKLFAIGGPTERTLPPRVVSKIEDDYNWCFVTSYPLPASYYHATFEDLFTSHEINVHNMGCPKAVFEEHLKIHSRMDKTIASELLKRSIELIIVCDKHFSSMDEFDLCDVDGIILPETIEVGIDMTLRYGKILNILSGTTEYGLNYIMKSCKALLGKEYCRSFDLFPATIFLMMKGDFNATWKFLEKFVNCSTSLYIWFERLVLTSQLNSNPADFSFSVVMGICDLIVQESLPSVYSAFKLSGTLPSVIFSYWIGQCFWNYLDWPEICNFILLTVIFGGAHAIYFFVAVLKHLKTKILRLSHSHSLITTLKDTAITEFSTLAYFDFMLNLANVHHDRVLHLINECTTAQDSINNVSDK